MKNSQKIVVLSAFVSLFCLGVIAGPGDTTVVQTFTWGSTQNAKFVFPPENVSYEKILMYYNLKCNPNQNPACGEWDYTTHTFLYDYLGIYDSTQMFQPSHVANGASPDTFMYMMNPSWEYNAWWEQFITYSSVISFDSSIIGSGSLTTSNPFGSSESDSRSQFLWTAAELNGAGVTAGEITGMRFNVDVPGTAMKKLTVNLKNSSFSALDGDNFENGGFTEVYSRNTSFASTGWNTISFTYPFTWDGTSNVVVEICYNNDIQGSDNTLLAENTGFNSGVFSANTEYYLSFNGPDYVKVPPSAFSAVSDEITISFWQYGDPAIQPQSDYLFEGYDANGYRVVNAHLPWGNGTVYWDAGNDNSSYDRILKAANTGDYEGQWNHWAFTKDISMGQMRMYLNGALFNLGGGKSKDMAGISQFKIGSNAPGTNSYDGYIDEFRIWDKALDQTTIQDWMYKDVDVTHPDYANLISYYQFNEGSGNTTADATSSGNDASLFGLPGWGNHDGCALMRNFQVTMLRPNVIFEQGVYVSTVDSVLIVDSVEQEQVQLILYTDSMNATTATDTLYVWNSYYSNYVYDSNGNAIDSTLVTPDNTLYLDQLEYYDVYEVVEEFELGRFITPYGNGLSLGNDGWTWIYDVSDYRTLLHDTVHLAAGNWQEYLDLKFLMIEGTPPREVLNVENLWRGNYYLATIDSTMAPWNVGLDPNADMFKLKTRASGHHWDNSTNCAEFCYKIHNVDVEDSAIYSWQIINECGMNPLYPQGGTWLSRRAGWCPGMPVVTQNVDLTPYVTPGDSVYLDYDSQTDQYGYYIMRVHLISYDEANFTLDAGMEEIISPNNWEIQNRNNPICDNPVIVIRNTGTTTLTSLDIEYGVQGGAIQTYQWTGSLPAFETEQVILSSVNDCWYIDGNSESNVFVVSLLNPNGGVDEYAPNNTAKSEFDVPPMYDNSIYLMLTTNSFPNETSYQLEDESGTIIYQSGGLSPNTMYRDTFDLAPGCYSLFINDSDCDGLSWWANSDGSGSARIYTADGSNQLLKNFEGDFGCQIAQRFTVGMPVFTVATTDATCGGLGGSATVTTVDQTATYSYAWSNSITNSTITNVAAGIYTVTVTSSNGCANVEQVMIDDAGAPSTSIVAYSDVQCSGVCDGTISVLASGGSAPYSYSWDDPGSQTDMTATGLCGGAFNVTVTDNSGCQSFGSQDIFEPVALTIDLYATDETMGCDGSIRANVAGGVETYSYLWDDGNAQSTYDAINLCGGIYSVNVTDANGCTVSGGGTVITSMFEPQPGLEVKVYPIPNKGRFEVMMTLGTREHVSIAVKNLLGQTVHGEDLGSSIGYVRHDINIKSAPAGIYFVQIQAGTLSQVVKIIKQ